MNHIYKTILNKKTGKIIVVSEKASSNCQSESKSDHNKSIINHQDQQKNISNFTIKKNILSISIGFFLTTILSTNILAVTSYTGDSNNLTNSGNIEGNFEQLIGNKDINGVIDFDTGLPSIPITSSSNITIDYSSGEAPRFVVAGYSFVNANNLEAYVATSNNLITLIQGDIDGSIYSGLSHVTTLTKDIDCSFEALNCEYSSKPEILVENKILDSYNNKLIIDKSSIAINNDIYAGYAGINLSFENVNSEANINNDDISNQNADTIVDNQANINTINSIENNVKIIGDNSNVNNIYSGYARINLNFENVSANASLDSSTLVNSNDFLSANSLVNANASVNSNKFYSNKNEISIDGNNSNINDIYAGYAGINLNYKDIYTISNNSSSLSNTGAYSNTDASSNINSNEINSNENRVVIDGNNNSFNDIYAGYAGINLNFENISAISTNNSTSDYENIFSSTSASSNTSANELNSNENEISIDGNNSNINDIYAGYAGINLNFENVNVQDYGIADVNFSKNESIINSSKNEISIDGNNSNINDIYAGYAGLLIDTISLKGTHDKTKAYYDQYNNEFISNYNNIQITGDSSNINDIYTGYSRVNIRNTNLNLGGITNNSNNNIFSSNKNSVEITGDKSDINNIYAGYAGINISADNVGLNNLTNVDMFINSNVDIDSNATRIDSNENNIQITGDSSNINDIYAGYSGINLNFENVSANSEEFNDTQAATFVNSNINSNEINSNENRVVIDGNNNSFNDIYAGYAGINLNYKDISANANSLVNANALVDVNALVNTNEINSNENRVVIDGNNNSFNDIYAGYAGINFELGNITSNATNQNGVVDSAQANLSINISDTIVSTTNNKISLTGSSTVSGNIQTGYIDFNIKHGYVEKADDTAGTIDINLAGTSATATENTITIDGEHSFTNTDASIYGGYLNYNKESGYVPESYDVFTGNTLNYANKTPISIGEVANFQTYNFTLTPELGNTATPLIHAKSIVLGSNESNISDGSTKPSDIYVVGIHSGKLIPTNTKFILLEADKGKLQGLGQGHLSTGIAQQGISLLYDVETSVDQTNDQVIAIINAGHTPPVDPVDPVDPQGPTVNPQLKALLAGNLSGLMLLTRGSDALSDQLFSAISEQNKNRGLIPFAIFSGNHSRYDTGSHIKSNGGLFTAGLSYQEGQATGGVFIENGWDSYKTFNDFDNANDVRGKGHNRFNGIGVYANYDFNNGWYADGLLRAGRLHTSFETDDIKNSATGERASYNIKGNYYGATLKGGYLLPWNAQNNVDLSAKYSWTSVESQYLEVADDPLYFNRLTSQRVTLNAENEYQMNPEVTLLTGLGYEYEFNGQAKGTTYGLFDIDEPSVKGSTGIAMLGVRYEPKQYENLSIDLKGSGYFGKREGGSALLKVDYKF